MSTLSLSNNKTKYICQQLSSYVDKCLLPFLKQSKSAQYALQNWNQLKKIINQIVNDNHIDKLQKYLNDYNNNHNGNSSPSSSGCYYNPSDYITTSKYSHFKTNDKFDKTSQRSHSKQKKLENINQNKFDYSKNINFGCATISKYDSLTPVKNDKQDKPYGLQIGSMRKIGQTLNSSSLTSRNNNHFDHSANISSDQKGFKNLINCFQKLIKNFENSHFKDICKEKEKQSQYSDLKGKKSKTFMKSQYHRHINNLIQ